MPEFARDEFGRSRHVDANFKAGPSSSYRTGSHDSRPQTHHSINKLNQRGEDEPHYGPASHEKADKNLYPGLVINGEVIRIESYGAFVSFRDRLKHYHKGLLHISQLAFNRVESVTDVLKMNQSVYAVVLEVEYDQRIGKRIRLSLKDVDQKTGKYTGQDISNGNRSCGAKGYGRRLSNHELQLRSKSRRDTLITLGRHWKDVQSNPSSTQNGVKNVPEAADKASLYLRKLWSSSPLRPSKEDDEPSLHKESRRGTDDTDVSSDSSSSDGSSDSSSSDSYESDRRRRRRGVRRRRNSKSRSRSHSRKRKASSRSRRSRRRSPSTSSSSSSSSSTSSTSSNENTKQDDKKIKLDRDTDKDDGDTNALSGLNDSDFKDAQAFKKAVQGSNDEEEEEGPMPLQQSSTNGGGGTDGNASYGKALLPGEGQALAQYVQQNLRIPRRGEIGFSGDDIELWEGSGYVMSGSRHTRMNAVRIRKENQVYSAEEQRALALLTMEENQQKEAQLMEDFRTMLKEKKKLRDQGK